MTVLVTSGQREAPCGKWNETFWAQIYAGTRGAREEVAVYVATVTREITPLKLPKQQPGRVCVQTGFRDQPWPSFG